jgi:hypothetical protein
LLERVLTDKGDRPLCLPTLAEVTEHANHALAIQQVFAANRFQIDPSPFFPPRLRVVSRRTSHSHARRVTDKYGELKHYEIKFNAFFPTNFKILGLQEYSSFSDIPIIGSFRTDSWQRFVECVIAHELSHCVEMFFQYHGYGHPTRNDWYHPQSSHHGLIFRNIYAIFREEFINPFITDFSSGPEFVVDDLKDRIAAMPTSPLTGLKFKVRSVEYEVIGYNPNKAKRLARYMVKALPNGGNYGIKLLTILTNSPEAVEIVKNNPELRDEFIAHHNAVKAKKEANQKSKLTKQRNRQGIAA